MKTHKQGIFLLLAISYIIYLIFGLLAEGTWDDDCIARFYATSNAFSDPEVWVSLFHRPIWVGLFALPVQLGYWVVPVIMSALCMLTAYVLYKSGKIKHQKYAWLLIILLLFQPFYFGVGKNALTEPLAALLIGLGYLAMVKKNYRWFVICGALLPLARLELAVLLSFWAIILIQHKQWKLIPFLGTGIIVWNIAGMLVTGSTDPIWLINEVLNRGNDPYGEISFFAFFDRYFYVVGPTTFVFLLIGLFDGIRKLKLNLFIHGQFIVGILLYSVLAAGWDTARSGAFLRHMIVLAPMAAVIALDGFNHIVTTVQTIKSKKVLAIQLALVLLICWVFFRNQLSGHHEYTETFSWVNFPSVVLLVVGIVFTSVSSRAIFKIQRPLILAIGIGLFTVSFTLITEHPDANINPERQALNEVADIYQETDLHSKKLLASHPHFLKRIDWPSQQWKTNLVTLENLQKAGPGTIVVWDGHYSGPNKGGIINTKIPTLGYVELFRLTPSDNSYSVIVYEKSAPTNAINVEERLENLLAAMPKSPHLYFGLSRYQFVQKNYTSAKKNIEHAIALDADQFVFHTMLGDLAILEQQLKDAIQHFNKSLELSSDQFGVHVAIGTLYFRLEQYGLAIQSYSSSLDLNPQNGDAYFKRGFIFRKLRQDAAACNDWQIGKRLGNAQAEEHYNLHCTGSNGQSEMPFLRPSH